MVEQNDISKQQVKEALEQPLPIGASRIEVNQELAWRLASTTSLSSRAEQQLGKDNWFNKGQPDSFMLSLQVDDRETTAENVQETTRAVAGVISDAIDGAESRGNKLLIIAGVYHENYSDALAAGIVFDAASVNDVTQFLIEESAAHADAVESQLREYKDAGLSFEMILDELKRSVPEGREIDSSHLLSARSIMLGSDDTHLHGVDPLAAVERSRRMDHQSTPDSLFQNREDRTSEEISNVINEIQQHAFYIPGVNHFKGLVNNENMAPDIEVLAFNVSHEVEIFNQSAIGSSALDAARSERDDYARDEGVREGEVIKITLRGKKIDDVDQALALLDEANKELANRDNDNARDWIDKVEKSQNNFENDKDILVQVMESISRRHDGGKPLDDKGHSSEKGHFR